MNLKLKRVTLIEVFEDDFGCEFTRAGDDDGIGAWLDCSSLTGTDRILELEAARNKWIKQFDAQKLL